MASFSLLGLSGSLRAASCNRQLLSEAARLGEVSSFSEANLRLPLYDGDLEQRDGIPSEVQALADAIAAADAVVISTPEYNKGPSGVLKNALDWVSRVDGNPWAGKPVALMSATAGRAGGERAQTMLRACMNPFQAHVLPGPEVLVGACHEAFDENGQLKSDLYVKAVSGLMKELREAAKA